MRVDVMQANAEEAVKQMLIGFSEEQKLPEVGTVTAEDQMDDGTPIRVCIQQSCILSATSVPMTPFATRALRIAAWKGAHVNLLTACLLTASSLLAMQLSVTIDRRDGSAVFDFEGTGPQVYGNTNAPPAVTYSAIIYSLRCMVHQDIPLNQVCSRR